MKFTNLLWIVEDCLEMYLVYGSATQVTIYIRRLFIRLTTPRGAIFGKLEQIF